MRKESRIKLSDNKYIAGLMGRDPVALNQFYEHFFPAIKSHVLHNNGNVEDAKDVFQEGLIVLYLKVENDHLKLTSKLSTYFYGICKLIWLKRLNKLKKIDTIELVDESLNNLDEGIQNAIEKSERYLLYQEKFDFLDGKCQRLLLLFFNGIKMSEIAKQLGFSSEGYAKKRKFKCKERLIKLIKNDIRYQELQESNTDG